MRHRRNRFFKDKALPHVECRQTYDSDVHYTPHRHSTLSIGAITDGQASFVALDHTEILTPQSLIVINPETVHACNPIEGEARSYLMLYLDVAWSVRLQNSLFGGEECYRPVTQTLIDDPVLLGQYHNLIHLLFDPQALYLEKEEALELFVLSLFGRYCYHEGPFLPIPPIQQQRIKRIQDYLRAHMDENPTTTDLAHAAQISPSHLIRLFGEATGLTPRRYLFELRIERAKELLSTTQMPISEIALEVGFFDQSHLNRVFKRIHGVTPGLYRNIVQDRLAVS